MTRTASLSVISRSPDRRGLSQVFPMLGLWMFRRQSRAHLSRLTGHMLRDIGLDCATVARESQKPFWRD